MAPSKKKRKKTIPSSAVAAAAPPPSSKPDDPKMLASPAASLASYDLEAPPAAVIAEVSSIVSLDEMLTFVSTSLPLGNGPVPPEVQASFNTTMKVMAKVNFSVLSLSRSVAWNVVLSQTCLHLTQECLHLQRSLESFHQTNTQEMTLHKKMDFLHNLNIRTHFKAIFLCFPFPSHLEVTTMTVSSLLHYGLSSTSPFATFIFDEFVFKAQGGTASESISVDDAAVSQSHSTMNDYNTPEGKSDLWTDIGPKMVQGVGKVCNMLVTLIRECLKEIVSCVNYSFCFLDDKIPKKGLKEGVGELVSKIYDPHFGGDHEVNLGIPFTCWEDLSLPHQKADAHIPIIVLAIVGFNSSGSFKFALQDFIGRMVFYNRSKFVDFRILQNNSSINLMKEARKYLNGCKLMDLVGPSEEAFLKFMALTEMMRYHCDDIVFLSAKYSPLFSPDDMLTLKDIVSRYNGENATDKAIKGHRTRDISHFISMRRSTILERKGIDALHPFKFSFPKDDTMEEVEVKMEGSNKMYEMDATNAASMSNMPDEDNDFDYSTTVGKFGSV